ncbi:hypothetical protein EK21DRAFT_118330 [Setomelanomma holmii]|uniref:Uncharacterized protein n=1 Tax=Setomelanomma holmii TaxID=210430 RepID=A0A9P4LH66_9PLEO|nr:hypothetical protein EK21DRAFT_118330 [Setomelanomma holmii]
MSQHPDYDSFITRRISIQKLLSSYRQDSPGIRGCLRWTRDCARVTSTMDESIAHDNTMPPPHRPTIARPPTPRPQSEEVVDSHRQSSPAAACLTTPRLVPVQVPKVAQDALSSPPKEAATSRGTWLTESTAQSTQFLDKAREEFEVFKRKERIAGYKRRLEKFDKNMRKEKEKQERDDWNREVRRQRPDSELWRRDFSFNVPTKRPHSFRTPPMSPKGSVLSTELTLDTSNEEREIKQRVDSSELDSAEVLADNFLRLGEAKGIVRPKNPGPSASEGRIQPWRGPYELPLFPPSTADPHPGSPVDFASPTFDCLDSFVAASPGARKNADIKTYHEHLSDLHRTSSPRNPILSVFDPCTRAEVSAEHQTKYARILGLSTTNIALPNPDTKSTSTRPPSCKSLPSLSNSVSTASALSPLNSRRTRTISTISDPSADAFLRHVRASQEARAAKTMKGQEKKKSMGVFIDEDEKGFLADGRVPL